MKIDIISVLFYSGRCMVKVISRFSMVIEVVILVFMVGICRLVKVSSVLVIIISGKVSGSIYRVCCLFCVVYRFMVSMVSRWLMFENGWVKLVVMLVEVFMVEFGWLGCVRVVLVVSVVMVRMFRWVWVLVERVNMFFFWVDMVDF